MEIFKNLGISFAYLVAAIILVSLTSLFRLGLNNRFGSGDTQGWGALITPLIALFPLAVALPFILKSSLKGFGQGSLLTGFGFIFVILFCFLGFMVSLYWLFLQTNLDDNPLIPSLCLWLFTSLIMGAVGTSFVGQDKFKVTFVLAFIVVGLLVLIPVFKVINRVADSKVVTSVEYNSSFNPHEYRIYQFPDFKFVPNQSLNGYLLRLKNEKQVTYETYAFVVRDGNFVSIAVPVMNPPVQN